MQLPNFGPFLIHVKGLFCYPFAPWGTWLSGGESRGTNLYNHLSKIKRQWYLLT